MQIRGFDSFANATAIQNKKNDLGGNFKEAFINALYSASELEQKQESLRVDFVNGELENMHDLTIATQKADIAIQTVAEVRNKVIDAYKEIMRMQI
ncbi:flagellar hook-basal body complex protein FliE [Peptoclostridium litorale DSM 5388]|uniref:Flagellar hook-basal body complex protein FliE n=1 Tax=Peptoclostridium litorale DSM 5388 TaxID=1121324 RepID=A0A069REH3_PEPLI|nr:flagellar hook-basal body complex protein FliE [Peptoclostridium litorale]KDR95158.1 hypothetical protein CLIT_11c01870 [Peptoclostridium litorale DSM 5388]SIN74079.1 flagellar hook-basal body complex protein FliE [Peptoclostridium litorale DSM 5388]